MGKLPAFKTIRHLGKVVAYYPALAKAFGVKEAIFLGQLMYWTPKARNSRGNGWVFKSAEELKDETALTYKEQLAIRKNLIKEGVLEEDYDRIAHTLWFRLKEDLFDDRTSQYVRLDFAEDGNSPYSQKEDGEMPSGEIPNTPKGISFLSSESTSESTAERQPRPSSKKSKEEAYKELRSRWIEGFGCRVEKSGPRGQECQNLFYKLYDIYPLEEIVGAIAPFAEERRAGGKVLKKDVWAILDFLREGCEDHIAILRQEKENPNFGTPRRFTGIGVNFGDVVPPPAEKPLTEWEKKRKAEREAREAEASSALEAMG